MKIVNVRDFGAKGDGCTLDTEAIQRAIDSCEKGDTLEFSGKGIFLTGTLRLKGDLKIVIAPDTEICGSRNLAHYYANEFYHNEMVETISLMYALDCDNIEISGGGKIQMNGDAFVNFDAWCPGEVSRKSMVKEFEEQTVVGPETKVTRPSQPIFFNNCKNIHIHDLKIFNAPCWTVVFSNCKNIVFEHMYVDNHNRIANNDGVHFSASSDIIVRDCIFLCGDDCFAATCITNENGVCENIEVSDCLMSSRSAAIRFGHLYSVVRNVVVKDIKILPSNRGISIFSGEGGIVENVQISNIECETRIHAGGWWGKGEGFVICAKDTSGVIKNVTIENCSFIEENPSLIAGTDGNVNGITMKGCTFEYKKGSTHPYFMGKMDLQPNVPQLTPAPFKTGDTLYVEGASHVVLNGETIA
ncbi:MAG: glycoside hydrolase [Clostridia bacterium]|nr:glycoside hydrolase [Clostridia bacterium]